MNPFIIEDAQARHQDYMNAAEHWQLQRQARAVRSRLPAQVRFQLADRLSALALRLKAYARPAAVSQ